MATSGWEHVSVADANRLGRRATGIAAPAAVKTKYRNVRIAIDGITFDSKREAQCYVGLKARLDRGEITELRLQPAFPLYCPALHHNDHQGAAQVATYVADFSYLDQQGVRHVIDAKGIRTQIFALKAKWLALQDNITIELI